MSKLQEMERDMAGGKTKVLVLCKESACEGGVVDYVDSVTKHCKSDSFVVERFTIGRRAGRESDLYFLLVSLYDYVRFFVKLFREDYGLIHLNPSLGKVAVLRDGIFILIAKLHGRKVLVFWHGWINSFQQRIESSPVLGGFFKLTFGKADGSIVLASSFKRQLEEWGFSHRIVVETTTFDESLTAGFDPGRKIGELRGSGKLTLLFLSRLEAAKGIVETIEAFSRLKNVGRELELIIAGDGPAAGLVKDTVDRSGDRRIKLLGFIRGEEKRAVLEQAHLLILPTSYGEGLPVCILEAMAFGLPVITTAVGGIPDNLTDGENGYFIDNVTGRSLAELLGKILADKDDLARIAANNFSVAGKKYPASAAALRIGAIYRQVVNGWTAPVNPNPQEDCPPCQKTL